MPQGLEQEMQAARPAARFGGYVARQARARVLAGGQDGGRSVERSGLRWRRRRLGENGLLKYSFAAGGFGKIAVAKRRFDLCEAPDAVHSVAYDFIERRRQQALTCRRPAAVSSEQDFHQQHGKIADIATARLLAGIAFGGFANAVAAQFDFFTHGVDVARLNVLVNESVGMQSFQSPGDREADFDGIGGRKVAPLHTSPRFASACSKTA